MEKYAARPISELLIKAIDPFGLKWWLYGGFYLSALSILLKTKTLSRGGAEGGIRPPQVTETSLSRLGSIETHLARGRGLYRGPGAFGFHGSQGVEV